MRIKKTNIKLRQPLLLLLTAIIIMAFSSCALGDVDPVDFNKERVDLKVEGDIISFVNQESSDLVSFGMNEHPIFNEREFKITIDLANNNSLDLTIYHKDFINPLDEVFQYSAYSLDLLDTKIAYVIGEYYIDGEKKFSSISNLVKGIIQINTFRAINNTNNYLLTIEDLDLFEVSEEGAKSNMVHSIKVNGTFTLLK